MINTTNYQTTVFNELYDATCYKNICSVCDNLHICPLYTEGQICIFPKIFKYDIEYALHRIKRAGIYFKCTNILLLGIKI